MILVTLTVFNPHNWVPLYFFHLNKRIPQWWFSFFPGPQHFSFLQVEQYLGLYSVTLSQSPWIILVSSGAFHVDLQYVPICKQKGPLFNSSWKTYGAWVWNLFESSYLQCGLQVAKFPSVLELCFWKWLPFISYEMHTDWMSLIQNAQNPYVNNFKIWKTIDFAALTDNDLSLFGACLKSRSIHGQKSLQTQLLIHIKSWTVILSWLCPHSNSKEMVLVWSGEQHLCLLHVAQYFGLNALMLTQPSYLIL